MRGKLQLVIIMVAEDALVQEVQGRIMRRGGLMKSTFLRTIAPSVKSLPLHHLQAALR